MARNLAREKGSHKNHSCMLEQLICCQLEKEKERMACNGHWNDMMLEGEIRGLGIKEAYSEDCIS